MVIDRSAVLRLSKVGQDIVRQVNAYTQQAENDLKGQSASLRQQGESPIERFLEQLSRSLQPLVRQNDIAVRYTSWSLAFVLPDTTLAGAQSLTDKLRRAASGLRPPWDSTQITLSAGIVEAVAKPDYDNEDIVTDLINRAEFSIEEARKRGGDTVVALEIPKL